MQPHLALLAFTVATTALWLPSNENQARALEKREDHCVDAYNNVDMFDCAKPEGHVLHPDGTCGRIGDFKADSTRCNVYCEVRRRSFLGPKQTPTDTFGDLQSPGMALVISEGVEVSITQGFSIGLDATWRDAVTLGVSFEYSVTNTNTKSIQREGEASDEFWNKWVFWPVMTMTCGNDPGDPGFQYDTRVQGEPPSCDNSQLTTVENVCSTVPLRNPDGYAKSVWSLEYVMEDGTPVPLEKQPESYQAAMRLSPDSNAASPEDVLNDVLGEVTDQLSPFASTAEHVIKRWSS
ncbi:hypothetical protein F5Y08DRAFT_346166 [Xylaria arbuscula]|nr:hypothetical protein F5Y08DRAFT_346166 [Xylaria arbuscula]